MIIVNEIPVIHFVGRLLRMQKTFQLQSFEDMLQSLQILTRFFDASHLQPLLNLSVDRDALFRLGKEVSGIKEAFPLSHSSVGSCSRRPTSNIWHAIFLRTNPSISETMSFISYIVRNRVARNVTVRIPLLSLPRMEIEVVVAVDESVLKQISGGPGL